MCDAPFVPEITASTDTSYFVDRYANNVDITTSFRASLTRLSGVKNEKDCLSEDSDENDSSSDGLFTGFDYSNIFNLKEMNDEQLGFKAKMSYEESIDDSESMSEMGDLWNDNGKTIQMKDQRPFMEKQSVDSKNLHIQIPTSGASLIDLFSPISDSEVVSSRTHSMLLHATQREEEVCSIPSMDSPAMYHNSSVEMGQMSPFQKSERTVAEQYRGDFCFDEDKSFVNRQTSSVDSSSEDSQNDMPFFDVKVEEDGEYVNYTVDFQNSSE